MTRDSEPFDWEPYLSVLREGGVVACATESLMGLLADATSADAVDRVVRIKGRAATDPIAVLAADMHAVEKVALPLEGRGRALAEAHWPGPLTLVVHARRGLPAALTRSGTIGVRIPGPSPAAELARCFGGPLTATSANRAGEPATSDPAAVTLALGDAVTVIPFAAPGGAPSTVVDVTVDPPRLLRGGAVHIDGM